MINISHKICIGWHTLQPITTTLVPDAVILPVGNEKNEKTKLDRLNHSYRNIKEYNNIPLPGFTIVSVQTRSADIVWVVIDPRGFRTTISSINLNNIIKVSGVTEGLIQERCVWSRNDNDTSLSLTPVTSLQYNEAMANTVILDNRINIDDVNIGDTVILQNGLVGKYLGVMTLYTSIETGELKSSFKVSSKARRQVIEVAPGKFHYHADIKVLSVRKECPIPMTAAQGVEYVNNSLNTISTFFSSSKYVMGGYYGGYDIVRFASLHTVPKPKITLVEINLHQATVLVDQAISTSDSGVIVLEDESGDQFLLARPWNIRKMHVDVNPWLYVDKLSKVSSDCIEIERQHSDDADAVTLDNFVKFYKIVKSVKNDIYI
jgi:hypothetical protein